MSVKQVGQLARNISSWKNLSWGRSALLLVAVKLVRLGFGGLLLLSAFGLVEGAIAPSRSTAQAQSVREDATTGTRVTTPFPNTFLITGGTVRESNLFHSFEEFSPGTTATRFDLQDSAYANVENVFSRVTGSAPSNLNGYLDIVGGSNPNLFLLNPNGVLIGPTAFLKIPGSFFVSSAEQILFEDGTSFSTTDTATSPLLSVSAPIGVQFGSRANPVELDGTSRTFGRYTFSDDSTVTLLGGGVNVTDAYFRTVAGRVQIGSVGSGALVALDGETHALTYETDTPLQDISFIDVVLDVDGKGNKGGDVDGDGRPEGGGNIQIRGATVRGDRLELLSKTSGPEDGGLIDIDADSLILQDSEIGSSVFDRDGSTATGRGSHIDIDAENLISRGTTRIYADTESIGDSGSITIDAKSASFEGSDPATTPFSSANLLSTSTAREGNAGKLSLRADNLSFSGLTFVSASTYQSTDPTVVEGTGGSIAIDAGRLIVKEGAQLGAATFSDGDSGEFTIAATEGIEISGSYRPATYEGETALSSGVFTTAERGSTGNGGNLTITAPRLILSDGGKISAGTSGSGNAGSVYVDVAEIAISNPVVDNDGSVSGITATVSQHGSGRGGLLNIKSDRLHLFEGGQITASTDGAGQAGSVEVISNIIDIEGTSSDGLFDSAISSRSTTDADAGSVRVMGDRITIANRGTISVSNSAKGGAGNVSLSAKTISLSDGTVEAEARAGSQGNINIESQDFLLLRQGSRITTNATETATGGNITIDSPVIVGAENSDISANAISGDGGRIRLITQSLVGLKVRDRLTSSSDITASSEQGVSGTVQIESPDVETDSGLAQLPENLEDASNQVAAGCAARADNQFLSTGRGGLPGDPTAQLRGNRLWSDMRSLTAEGTTLLSRVAEEKAAVELVEAQNWQVNAAGDVELMTASAIAYQAESCLEKVALAQ